MHSYAAGGPRTVTITVLHLLPSFLPLSLSFTGIFILYFLPSLVLYLYDKSNKMIGPRLALGS